LEGAEPGGNRNKWEIRGEKKVGETLSLTKRGRSAKNRAKLSGEKKVPRKNNEKGLGSRESGEGIPQACQKMRKGRDETRKRISKKRLCPSVRVVRPQKDDFT